MLNKQNKHKKQLGAAMIEYGLLAALIAVVCILALKTIGTNLNTKFSSVGSAVT